MTAGGGDRVHGPFLFFLHQWRVQSENESPVLNSGFAAFLATVHRAAKDFFTQMRRQCFSRETAFSASQFLFFLFGGKGTRGNILSLHRRNCYAKLIVEPNTRARVSFMGVKCPYCHREI